MTQSSSCFSVGIVTLHYKDSGFEIFGMFLVFWHRYSSFFTWFKYIHVQLTSDAELSLSVHVR